MAVLKQRLNESMGQSTKTIDLDLQPRFDLMHTLFEEYKGLEEVGKSLARHLITAAKAHEGLGTCFGRVAESENDTLQQQFSAQAQFMVRGGGGRRLPYALHFNMTALAQTVAGRNLHGLGEAMAFFQQQVSLMRKELEGVLRQIKAYDVVRLEYDGYRVTYEKLKAANRKVCQATQLAWPAGPP